MYSFTRFTSDTPDYPVNKVFAVGPDGPMAVKGKAMFEGKADTISVASMAEFVKFLKTLNENQFHIYGVCGHPSIRIVTEKKHRELGCPDDPIPRSAKNFEYPRGAGFLCLDYDPTAGTTPLSHAELLERLFAVVPELRDAPLVLAHSASSYIFKPDGTEYRGDRGKHVYAGLRDASDIARFGAVLFKKLIAHGLHRYQVAESGGVLKRTLVDAAMFRSAQPDFAFGAICRDGLYQARPAPVVMNPDAPPFGSRAIVLSADEERAYEREDRAATARLKPEAQKPTLRVHGWTSQGDKPLNTWSGHGPQAPFNSLTRVYVKSLADGTPIDRWYSWGELTYSVATRKKFDGAYIIDPFTGKDAVAITGKRPARIRSFAHGEFFYYPDACQPNSEAPAAQLRPQRKGQEQKASVA